MAEVYLILGSNIRPSENVPHAIRLLRESPLLEVLAISPIYETAPVGYTEQDHFWNAAIHLRTTATPTEIKAVLLDIEQTLGRVRDPLNKNAPRTIDLDIALWDDAIFEYGERPWQVPDKDILRFVHVARPLADLAPDYRHPEIGQTLVAIADSLPLGGIAVVDQEDFR